MPTEIRRGAQVLRPDLVTGYESERRSRNLVHELLGSGAPHVTIQPASLRSGTLTLLFVDEQASWEAEQAHALSGVFQLTDTARSTILMSYVPGSIRRTLDEQTRSVWLLSIGYQEVTA